MFGSARGRCDLVEMEWNGPTGVCVPLEVGREGKGGRGRGRGIRGYTPGYRGVLPESKAASEENESRKEV